jgi:spore coat protein A
MTAARADARDRAAADRQVPSYRILMTEAAVKVHRDIPLTRVWTYGGSFPGPTLEARRDQPIRIEWINALPRQAFLPAGGEPDQVRASVHVHGALAPADSDCAPDGGLPPGKSIVTTYPNAQEAATLWYHDGARGAARFHQYAGLMGLYLLRDDHEAGLGLPDGPLELPLVICERWFGQDGQLRAPGSDQPALLVNGKLLPYAEVPPRRHRLRIVNASTAAACTLSFDPPIAVHQIGTDQGLLAAPIEKTAVHLAPGERADLLADFSRAGQSVMLNDRGRELMQFRMTDGPPAREALLPRRLRELPLPRLEPSVAAASRSLLISEPREGAATALEQSRLHTGEIWNLVNQSAQARVVHVHGVRFRVVDELHDGDGAIDGWKDTVQVEPLRTTRIWAQFDGTAGRYEWESAALGAAARDVTVSFQVVGPPT